MDNIYDLLNNLKTVSQGTQKTSNPMKVDYAVVTKVDPLELDFGEFKAEEDDELLTISEYVTILQKGKITFKGGTLKLKFTNCSGSTEQRDFEIYDDSELELKDPKKLEEGDCLICFQEEGAEGWVVVDRVEKEDDE